MAEQTKGDITINASAEEIMEALTDFGSYPKWTDVKTTKVENEDSQGRGTEVYYEVKVPMLGEAKYTLAYRYKARDGGMSWTTKSVDEGPMKDIKGEYTLEELDEDETKVTYKMTIQLGMKVPGMLKKRGEKTVIDQALKGLKKRVESG